MKKIIAVLLFTVFYSIGQAQITLPKIDTNSGTTTSMKDFVKPPAIGDIVSTTSSIVDLIGSKLSLPAALKPKLTDSVSSFLTNKKGIASLADSTPKDYLAKFNPLQKGLFENLKGIMGTTAFTKFLGLKPSGSNISGNVLSHLFF
jgi:hypothetical protein